MAGEFYICDAITFLRTIGQETVDCCVTSPPYFGQRDYGHPDQVGSESTVEDYIDRLVAIFKEVRCVLKSTGTLWLNLGDKYLNGQLAGVPWRVALALQMDGWLLRSDIVWNKPNPMPESVKNRPSKSHEYVFLFSKTDDYYYNSDAIREPIAESTIKRFADDPYKKRRPNGQPTYARLNGETSCGVNPRRAEGADVNYSTHLEHGRLDR